MADMGKVMFHFLNKTYPLNGFSKTWHYYVFSFLLITITSFFALLMYGYFGEFAWGIIIIKYAILFITALKLGRKNMHRKWLYPVFAAVFVYLKPYLIFFVYFNPYHLFEVHRFSRDSIYYLMNILFYTFVAFFAIPLVAAVLGMGVGVLLFRRQGEKRSDN